MMAQQSPPPPPRNLALDEALFRIAMIVAGIGSALSVLLIVLLARVIG